MSLFDVPQEVLNARPQGAKDFDFLQGRWLIHHKKLAERLVGCQTWYEFETPAANQLILGGLGNIDHCRIESGDFYEGASLRLFDKASRLWRIYWMDTNGATLFPPVEGSFSDTVGLFRGHDQHNGIPVLVEFRWDKTNPETPTWQQSFSADNGNNWESELVHVLLKARRLTQRAARKRLFSMAGFNTLATKLFPRSDAGEVELTIENATPRFANISEQDDGRFGSL